jgi:hypothetical protein
MSKYRMRAAALITAGAVAGGATAATLSASADDSGSGSSASTGVGEGRGPGGHGRGGAHVDSAALAEALGVTEDELETALDAVRDELEPGTAQRPADGERPAPPTEAEREERSAAFAKALADELGIDEAKVTDALEGLHEAARTEHRSELGERLDQAIEDGDLDDTDKASVLKAYDAGVLGRR